MMLTVVRGDISITGCNLPTGVEFEEDIQKACLLWRKGQGVLKNRTKLTREKGRGSNLSVRLLVERNCLIFHTANRILSDKLLDSCYKFYCSECSLAYKGVFWFKKGSLYFFHWTYFYKLVNIFVFIVYIAVYNCVKNTDFLSFLPVYSPMFQSKIYKGLETLFEVFKTYHQVKLFA